MERLRPGDPEQIGPWQIVNRLGSGGMGIVYMGNNGTRAAAVKIVRDFLLEDPAARGRLNREVQSLKKVKSQFVAEIVGADIDSTPAWIATNFVDGPSLKTLVDKEGPLSEARWLELAFGLMSALDAVHSAGVIHRDVKPSNILMSATGPKLIDFGISFSSDATSLTRTGLVAGSPSWFAPEQFESNKVTSAVDNFAAGTVLYFAATGKNPWGKEDASVAKTMNMILTKEIDPSILTQTQQEVILRLLKKSSKERATAAEILGLLKEVENRPSANGTNSKSHAAIKKTRRKVAITLLVATVLAGLGFIYQNQLPFGQLGTTEPTNSSSQQTKWRLLIDGDEKAQRGVGSSYSTFICDQGVLEESLQLQELTNPPAAEQPKLKLLKGDPRCGKNFDTILIEGQLDFAKKERDYVLAGSTETGFIIQYKFTISKVD